MRYRCRITGRYPSGRRVWLWARGGRWWVCVEVGTHEWYFGDGGPKRSPRLASWQREA